MTNRKEHIRNIEKAIERLKRESKKHGRHFTSVTPDRIERMYNASNPSVLGWSITNSTPGGTVDYVLNVYNSGPFQAMWLYAHIWVGFRLVNPADGTFLVNDVDTRFPRLTGPGGRGGQGLTVDPGAQGDIPFTLGVPNTVERGMYCLYACLTMLTNSRADWLLVDRHKVLFEIA
jgi:hypothetical protein